MRKYIRLKINLFQTNFAISFLFLFGLFTSSNGYCQTNPTPLNLPVFQDFGTTVFSTFPAGFSSWNGLSGSTINSQTAAESSTPNGNATINNAIAATNNGGTYGYATSNNAGVYIQTSTNSSNGVNQLAFAINIGTFTAIHIYYDLKILTAATGTTGTVLQFRSGTTGSWTTVTNSALIYNNTTSNGGDTDSVGDIDTYDFILTGLLTTTNYQFRFAHWKTGAATSEAIVYDSITILGAYDATYTNSGTFTVPTNTISVKAEAWGAGGGGSGPNTAANGGGGGAYASSLITTSFSSYTITIGNGGSENADGGNSSFSNLVVADGGKKGTTSNGGFGGTTANSNGTIKFNGGNGGTLNNRDGGGGGGSAYPTALGSSGTQSRTGASGYGFGGSGGRDGNNGSNGNFPGGGGGGAGRNANSGTGGAGLVIVYYEKGGTSSTTSTTICSGSSGSIIVSGNSTSVSKWQSSTNNGSTWSDITNITTTLSYTNLTTTTQYRAIIGEIGNPQSYSTVTTITVNPLSNGGTVTGGTTICSGATSASLTVTGHTGTITKWQSAVSPFTTWTDIDNTVTTYTSGTLSETTQFRAIVQSGVCASATSGVTTVTVNSTSVGGTISGSATVCPGTNATSLSLSGNTGAIQWQNSSDNSAFSDIVSATGTTYIASNLNATTYFRTVATNGVCSSANCPSVSVDVRTTTFNGTTWSNGNPATNATIIYNLTGNYILPSDVAACSCTITSGNITVPSGKSMNLIDKLTVSSGSITFENNANLIQTNLVTNSGVITVKRNSDLQVRLDHTLWSSPVANVNLFGFSPLTLTNRFYTYDTATNTYTNTGLSVASAFIIGKGFAVRAPNTFPSTPQTWEGVFTGIPNNGNIPFTLETTGTGYNLVGNPYPSPIDATRFVSGNPNIGGSLYFYAHTLTMGSNGLFPAGTNYAVWNASGSTAASLSTSGVPSLLPNGIIQVGQGFIVKATGAGTVSFNNGMRVNDTQNQFLRNATTIERHRLWLNLSNDAGTDFNQILLGYIEGATMGFDSNFDALAFGNSGSSLSSKIDGLDYTIQGRALAFSDTDTVLLGFKAAVAGNYIITLTEKDGLFLGNQPIYILDTTTNSTHEIKTTPYSFYSEAGTFDTRFQLVYSSTLGIPTSEFSSNSVVAYKKDGVFNVSSQKTPIKEILAYDNLGRLIFKRSNINSQKTSLTGLSTTNEILFLKVISQEDGSVTIKIIN